MLISLRRICLAYGAGALLDDADFTVARGERVALVGRNGAGKSTLLGVIAGTVTPDSGTVEITSGTRVARLEQDVPPDAYPNVRACVAAGLGTAGQALADYHALGARLTAGEDVDAAYARAHAAVDAAHAWGLDAQIEAALTRLGMAGDAPFAALSGGERRQAALERTLLAAPDVLLLDEPTNHLDVRAIAALEARLREHTGALVFVTHDRAFLRALATRIVELDRGRLSSHPGDYEAFLGAQAKAAQDEARTNALFDKHLAQEEAWIRQGIKARRTRNEGRVRALEALRVERRARRGREGQARLQTGTVSHSGRVVFEVQGLRYAWPGAAVPVVADLSTVIERGDKVALIGPNGCGKSTLIRLLLGDLKPDAGSVRIGTGVEVAYFDQHRAALDGTQSVAQIVAPDSEYVDIAGQRRHVMGYLQDFLFTPQRARTPVRALSGGERSRVALARLFTRPANLLVLDEPTNDLDVETLELLEALLADYAGTVLLVSHDRAFVDNVATATLAFEGDGQVREYVGGYTDWLRQRPAPEPARPAPAPVRTPAPAITPRAAPTKTGLNDAQRRELRQLPARIETLEKRIADLQAACAVPGYYARDRAELAADARVLADTQADLETAYARWEALEAGQAG